MAQELAGMRVDYVGEGLDVEGLAGTWHEQLVKWFAEAQEAGFPEVNAMVLATANAEGRPSSRTVLCKGFDERGVGVDAPPAVEEPRPARRAVRVGHLPLVRPAPAGARARSGRGGGARGDAGAAPG